MLAYLVRRVLYAIPILIGVNLLTFVLFFVVNSPDDMARMQIGVKRATPEAIERWKAERGYDKPMFVNAEADGSARFTETIFFDKSLRMFALAPDVPVACAVAVSRRRQWISAGATSAASNSATSASGHTTGSFHAARA